MLPKTASQAVRKQRWHWGYFQGWMATFFCCLLPGSMLTEPRGKPAGLPQGAGEQPATQRGSNKVWRGCEFISSVETAGMFRGQTSEQDPGSRISDFKITMINMLKNSKRQTKCMQRGGILTVNWNLQKSNGHKYLK